MVKESLPTACLQTNNKTNNMRVISILIPGRAKVFCPRGMEIFMKVISPAIIQMDNVQFILLLETHMKEKSLGEL